MRAWPVLPLAFLAWFVGLAPWLVIRSTVGTFGTPWNPRNHLREALLPFHYQRLPLLLTVVVIAGALAGAAPFWCRERRRRRWLMSFLASTGACAATGLAVWQSVGPRADLRSWLGSLGLEQVGCIALTVGGTLVGLLLGLAVSLGSPVVRTLAAAVVVTVGSGWVGLGVTTVLGPRSLSWLPAALVVAAGGVTGILLALLGTRPRRRLLAWVAACVLLVVTAAALTASRYVLEGLRGTQTSADAVRELLGDGLEVFGRSTAVLTTAVSPSSPVTTVLVALAVGALGTALLESLRASRPPSTG